MIDFFWDGTGRLTLIGMSYECKKNALGQPRSKFYKTQWAWQGDKLTRLNFGPKSVESLSKLSL